MPFKSKAQIAKFAQLVKEGKMSQATFDEWMSETGSTKILPERVKKQGRPRTKVGKVKKI